MDEARKILEAHLNLLAQLRKGIVPHTFDLEAMTQECEGVLAGLSTDGERGIQNQVDRMSERLCPGGSCSPGPGPETGNGDGLDVAMMQKLHEFGGLLVYRVSYFNPATCKVVEETATFNEDVAKDRVRRHKERGFSAGYVQELVNFDGMFTLKAAKPDPERRSDPGDAILNSFNMAPTSYYDRNPTMGLIQKLLVDNGLKDTPANRVRIAFGLAEKHGYRPSLGVIQAARSGVDTYPFSLYQEFGIGFGAEMYQAEKAQRDCKGGFPIGVRIHTPTTAGAWVVYKYVGTEDQMVLATKSAVKAFKKAKALLQE